MRKYFFMLLVMILGISIFLIGCGGDNSSGTPPPLSLTMISVPGAASFPIGTDDSGTCCNVNYPYYIAQTEVTFQQWSTVYTWAVSHGYTFAHTGSRGAFISKERDERYDPQPYESGHDSDPVTHINWRDTIVWCNALTEYCNAHNGTNLGCVYNWGGNPIRNSTDTIICDTVVPEKNAKGFRLPTSMEWELAARYKGNDSSNGAIFLGGLYWTPSNYASGAAGSVADPSATLEVAWTKENSTVPDSNIYSTQPVGTKTANFLGVFDMSGNVEEWSFDIDFEGFRIIRGGNWRSNLIYLGVSKGSICDPGCAIATLGFRPVRVENLVPPKTLVSISISPIPGPKVGKTNWEGVTAYFYHDFTAKGYYSDGTKEDITLGCTWYSDDPSVCLINSSGRFDYRGLGSTTIHALKDGINSSISIYTKYYSATWNSTTYFVEWYGTSAIGIACAGNQFQLPWANYY